MPEPAFPWPRNSWTILTKIIRAWFSVETSGGEVTQKRVAEVAGVQQSQVSTNKPFLQAVGIIGSEGLSLTEAGKRLGIGLYSDNANMRRQGLEQAIRSTPLLKDMLDIVRGRGVLKVDDFYAETALRVGGKDAGFTTGVTILIEILIQSGSIQVAENNLRPVQGDLPEQMPTPGKEDTAIPQKVPAQGLNRIPIPVSPNAVWWIEVAESPTPEEIQKFLDMQKLMFG